MISYGRPYKSSLDVIETGGVGVEGVELNEDEDEEHNEGGSTRLSRPHARKKRHNNARFARRTMFSIDHWIRCILKIFITRRKIFLFIGARCHLPRRPFKV